MKFHLILPILASAQLLLLGWGFYAGMQIVSDDPGQIRLPLGARIILSLSLVFTAFIVSLTLKSTVSNLVLLGMILSFFGDLFNAEVIPLPVPLLGGMTAFGGAHCFYIAAFYLLLKPTGVLISTWYWIGSAVVWLVTITGWVRFIRNPDKIPALNCGSLIYALLVGTMAYCSFIVAFKLGGWWWIIPLGAVLFYISDTIIGITDIGRVMLKRTHLWIWLTYIMGQMGIIYGVWLGLAL